MWILVIVFYLVFLRDRPAGGRIEPIPTPDALGMVVMGTAVGLTAFVISGIAFFMDMNDMATVLALYGTGIAAETLFAIELVRQRLVHERRFMIL